MKITATEFKKHLGKYMDMAADGQEIIVLKNGKSYIEIKSSKRDPVMAIKNLVGIVREDDFPPEGEDPKFDRIMKRGEYESHD